MFDFSVRPNSRDKVTPSGGRFRKHVAIIFTFSLGTGLKGKRADADWRLAILGILRQDRRGRRTDLLCADWASDARDCARCRQCNPEPAISHQNHRS